MPIPWRFHIVALLDAVTTFRKKKLLPWCDRCDVHASTLQLARPQKEFARRAAALQLWPNERIHEKVKGLGLKWFVVQPSTYHLVNSYMDNLNITKCVSICNCNIHSCLPNGRLVHFSTFFPLDKCLGSRNVLYPEIAMSHAWSMVKDRTDSNFLEKSCQPRLAKDIRCSKNVKTVLHGFRWPHVWWPNLEKPCDLVKSKDFWRGGTSVKYHNVNQKHQVFSKSRFNHCLSLYHLKGAQVPSWDLLCRWLLVHSDAQFHLFGFSSLHSFLQCIYWPSFALPVVKLNNRKETSWQYSDHCSHRVDFSAGIMESWNNLTSDLQKFIQAVKEMIVIFTPCFKHPYAPLCTILLT